MPQTKADFILHPVRFRIIRTLTGQTQTVSQLAEQLSDIAPATLYRHVNALVKAGFIREVDKRQVRGGVEKTYGLSSPASLSEADLAKASHDDHLRYFTTFSASLIDDFARYLDNGPPSFESDGVGYRQVTLYLSDEEFAEFATALNQALLPFATKPPAPGRKRRAFSTIVMPLSESEPNL